MGGRGGGGKIFIGKGFPVGPIFCNHAYYFLIFLRSQLYLWGSPFFMRFLCFGPSFFHSTIEVVTFCLRGWCMLGVFLMPAFTHQGHVDQDLLSLCDGMHACTDWTLDFSLI